MTNKKELFYTHNRCLKFLFLTYDKYPPFRPDIQVLFGKKLAARGHHIDMIIQSEKANNRTFKTVWNNIHITVTPSIEGASLTKKIKKNFLSFFSDFRLFVKVFKKDYDFVQVKDKFITALLGILACKLKKIPFIFWLSFSIPEEHLYKARQGGAKYPLLHLLRGWFCHIVLYRVISRFADHVFVQSEKMKEDVTVKGIPTKKTTVVPMGISSDDIPKINEIKTQGISDSEKRLIYIGAMDKPRRLDFLFRVVRLVRERIDDVKLYMVGSAYNHDDIVFLEEAADSEGVADHVIFKGFLPRKEVWKLVAEANVCLSPMYPAPMLLTTSPTKCIEYLGIGKPVVGNDIPDMEKVLSESGGGICVPWEEKDFADAIIYLLEHKKEAELMGQKGKEWVMQNREYELLASLVETKYFEIINSLIS